MERTSRPLFEHDAPTGELQRGDVCGPLAFPSWRLTEYFSGNDQGSSSQRRLLVHGVAEEDVYALICSHDCDVANPRDRRGILLAPVLPSPIRPDNERFPILEASAAPDGETWHYVNLFPIRLAGPESPLLVADFSALTSAGPVSKASVILSEKRVAWLTNEFAVALERKLLVFIGRHE